MPTISGWSTGEPVASADINTFLLRGNRNAIINGDMRINQRQVSSVSDDAYCLDRWNILSDGATISVAQSTVAPTDGKYSLAMQSGTNAKKFGCVQYIENLNCVGMFGQTVTLSFKARVSNATNLPNIKAGILSWSSTADTLTSDFVSSWNASGTTPTLIANWTFENTPSNLGVTTSWATYRVQGVIDTAGVNNVAVFIWSDSTANTTSDVLYVTDVQCEIGTIATPFERRSMTDQLLDCQRYYNKWVGSANAYQLISELNPMGYYRCDDPAGSTVVTDRGSMQLNAIAASPDAANAQKGESLAKNLEFGSMNSQINPLGSAYVETTAQFGNYYFDGMTFGGFLQSNSPNGFGALNDCLNAQSWMGNLLAQVAARYDPATQTTTLIFRCYVQASASTFISSSVVN